MEKLNFDVEYSILNKWWCTKRKTKKCDVCEI